MVDVTEFPLAASSVEWSDKLKEGQMAAYWDVKTAHNLVAWKVDLLIAKLVLK
jgi:hypothetical protein